jgi:hypothetical protein
MNTNVTQDTRLSSIQLCRLEVLTPVCVLADGSLPIRERALHLPMRRAIAILL